MRVFLSAGEPSGDLHGGNLVEALRHLQPDVECIGFGGERMDAAGCRLLYPLSRLAVMGLLRVLTQGPIFLELVSRADRFFRHQRPDAVVLIDYPGFNWWLARRAHFHGIPVLYFVPPQLWGWAGWRVKKVRRWVDHVLGCLPFEVAWYRERGVRATYVGHPYFDELPRQRLDASFLKRYGAGPGEIVGLLPGSRTQEVEHNLSNLIGTAVHIHAARPGTRFLVACFKPAHQHYVETYLKGQGLSFIEPFTGRTPEIIHLAHSCVAVSGSVGLELLYRAKPSVITYRARSYHLFLCRYLKKSPYISLVNLLAGKELFPEYLTDRCVAGEMAGHVLRWLSDPAAYRDLVDQLTALRRQVAEPGACERAARCVLEEAISNQRSAIGGRRAA